MDYELSDCQPTWEVYTYKATLATWMIAVQKQTLSVTCYFFFKFQ